VGSRTIACLCTSQVHKRALDCPERGAGHRAAAGPSVASTIEETAMTGRPSCVVRSSRPTEAENRTLRRSKPRTGVGEGISELARRQSGGVWMWDRNQGQIVDPCVVLRVAGIQI